LFVWIVEQEIGNVQVAARTISQVKRLAISVEIGKGHAADQILGEDEEGLEAATTTEEGLDLDLGAATTTEEGLDLGDEEEVVSHRGRAEIGGVIGNAQVAVAVTSPDAITASNAPNRRMQVGEDQDHEVSQGEDPDHVRGQDHEAQVTTGHDDVTACRRQDGLEPRIEMYCRGELPDILLKSC